VEAFGSLGDSGHGRTGYPENKEVREVQQNLVHWKPV
jgi:hypothetical protein